MPKGGIGGRRGTKRAEAKADAIMKNLKEDDYRGRVQYTPTWLLEKKLPHLFESFMPDEKTLEKNIWYQKETEKAVLIAMDNGWGGSVETWIPKSLLNNEHLKKGLVSDYNWHKKIDRAVDGLEYNQRLIKYAKEHKVKGIREIMGTKKVIAKMEEARVKVPSRTKLLKDDRYKT